MNTVLLLQNSTDDFFEFNKDDQPIHVIINGRAVGSFIPKFINGNPYQHMDQLKELTAVYPALNLSLDNTSIMVYSLVSGTSEKHAALDFA